jgi:four helix bundle protein
MNEVKRFEDLIAWQKARTLTREIYLLSTQGLFARDFGLNNQIQRASVSIMSNLAEGFERNGSREFSHFLSMAKASCAELRSQLYVASDIGYLNRTQFDHLFALAEEVGRIIGGLHATIRRRSEKR